MEDKDNKEKQRPYAEKLLLEKLEYATDRLTPSFGYEIELVGTPLKGIVKKELEALFGSKLEDQIDVLLQFSEQTNFLDLKSFHVYLANGAKKVGLTHVPDIGFLPDKIDSEFFVSQSTLMDEQSGLELVEKLKIDTKPPKDPNEYALWRSKLLSRSQAWETTERIEIPTKIDNSFVESASLEKKETYKPKSNLIVRDRLVKKTVTTFLGRDLVSTISSVMHSVDDQNNRVLNMYEELIQPEYKVSESGETHNQEGAKSITVEPLELDLDSTTSFAKIIDEIVAHQHLMAQLKPAQP